MIYACHCTICQRQSGSAFGMAVVFSGGDMAMVGSIPRISSGKDRAESSAAISARDAEPGSASVVHGGRRLPVPEYQAGTLDDTSWLRPGCHVWTQHAQPWVRFSEDDVVFEQQPTLEEMPRFEGA